MSNKRREALVKKYGSEKAYREHMRKIASRPMKQETIDKQMETKRKKYDQDYWKRVGATGGRPKQNKVK